MRALGFALGIGAAAALWYWQQAPHEPLIGLEDARPASADETNGFGDDVGDYGAQTLRVPASADWIVKPAALAQASPAAEPTAEWLVITRPFSSESSATAFSDSVAQNTGLNLAVKNPGFREYQVAVQLDGDTTRDQALAVLGSQYAWMQFD